jgi:hypothetical protein
MADARYDAVADFYEIGWTDSHADSVSAALFNRSLRAPSK